MRALVSGSIVAVLLAGIVLGATEAAQRSPSEQARLTFERQFEHWVSAMDVADDCNTVSFDNRKVAEISHQAAATFYPGLRNILKRDEYVATLASLVPPARLAHAGGFIVGDCASSEAAATFARWPVDTAIEQADRYDK